MTNPGDLFFARFPIELDLDAPADTIHQFVPGGFPLFPTTLFDSMAAKILPITGTGGKSKAVVVVVGRSLV